MSELASVDRELEGIMSQVQPLLKRAEELRRVKRRIESENWITANRVNREDVEFSSGDGKPYFGNIETFAKWMKANSSKRFCEWNERIYFTSEIIAGRMDPGAPATIQEL